MNRMDDLERILATDPQIEPSPELARRVMTEVLREARLPRPIPFPWRRFIVATAGIAGAAAAVAASPGVADALRRSFDAAGEPASFRLGGGTLAIAGALAIAAWGLWTAARAD
jgi:hypothetical protein